MYYKNFEISVGEFRSAHCIFTGQISKIIIEDRRKTRVVFAFAIDLLSIVKYSLDVDELLKSATKTVKSKIDEGTFDDLELTYEYVYPYFVQVNNPKWWEKNNKLRTV